MGLLAVAAISRRDFSNRCRAWPFGSASMLTCPGSSCARRELRFGYVRHLLGEPLQLLELVRLHQSGSEETSGGLLKYLRATVR
jgi:hypothetical protein